MIKMLRLREGGNRDIFLIFKVFLIQIMRIILAIVIVIMTVVVIMKRMMKLIIAVIMRRKKKMKSPSAN